MSTATGWTGSGPRCATQLRDERGIVGTVRRQESAPAELKVRISQPEGMARALESFAACRSRWFR